MRYLGRVLLIVLFCFSNHVKGSENEKQNSSFIIELLKYIENVNTYSIKYGSSNHKYNVYTLIVSSKNSDRKEICFKMSYIKNSDDVKYFFPSHILSIEGEVILVNLENEADLTIFDGLDLVELRLADELFIQTVQKMYPSVLGGFTYSPSGAVICCENGGCRSTFYQNYDDISEGNSMPDDFKIELIENRYNQNIE